MSWKHFSDYEVLGLQIPLVDRLDRAREEAGVPFVITEGLGAGGHHVANTSHQRGWAVDLRCRDSFTRFKMVSALLNNGFKRIGIYNLHIHADLDDSLDQEVIWTGESH